MKELKGFKLNGLCLPKNKDCNKKFNEQILPNSNRRAQQLTSRKKISQLLNNFCVETSKLLCKRIKTSVSLRKSSHVCKNIAKIVPKTSYNNFG